MEVHWFSLSSVITAQLIFLSIYSSFFYWLTADVFRDQQTSAGLKPFMMSCLPCSWQGSYCAAIWLSRPWAASLHVSLALRLHFTLLWPNAWCPLKLQVLSFHHWTFCAKTTLEVNWKSQTSLWIVHIGVLSEKTKTRGKLALLPLLVLLSSGLQDALSSP